MLEIAKSLTELSTEKLEIFFLVLVRCSFLIFLFPFFNNQMLSMRVKAGLAFFLAMIFFPISLPADILIMNSSATFFYLVLKEAILGFSLGFGSQFLVFFVNFGGYVIGRDMGFMQAQAPDVMTGDMSNNLSNFLMIMFAVIFLLTGGHYFFIQLLDETFRVVPVAGWNYSSKDVVTIMMHLSGTMFLQGFKLAAPIMGTLLVTQIGMAFIARVMPQMNIWILGIPLKIGLGVILLIALLPMMYQVFDDTFRELQYSLVGLVRLNQ